MTANLQEVFQAVKRLSPPEQLELIQAISQSLLQQYQPSTASLIPPEVRRTPSANDLARLAADFWPADETADDINDYIAAQRHEDRMGEP